MGGKRLARPSVVIPVVVLVVVGAVWMGIRSGNGAAATTTAVATSRLVTVSPAGLAQTVSASGTIAPAETENLSFGVAGTVTAVNVKAGETVEQGQVLATLGSAALDSAVAQAQASLASAGARLSDDQSAAASSAQITADQSNVASAYADLAAAVQSASGARLTSPIAGTVATVDLTVGEVLGSSGGSGTSITGTGTGSGLSAASPSTSASTANGSGAGTSSTSSTSSASSQIEVISSAYVVNLSVGTTTIGNVKVGQSATVTPMSSSGNAGGGGGRGGFGGGGVFGGGAAGAQPTTGGSATTSTATGASATGTVTSVGAIASSSSGVATFPVVITLPGTPAGFHAGASASVAITYNTLANVLAVPANAVTQSNGASYVTVSTNGKTAQRSVTTGVSSGGQVQITSGLQSGDQVVVPVPTLGRSPASAGGGGTRSAAP